VGRGSVAQLNCALTLSFGFFSLQVKVYPYKIVEDNTFWAITIGIVARRTTTSQHPQCLCLHLAMAASSYTRHRHRHGSIRSHRHHYSVYNYVAWSQTAAAAAAAAAAACGDISASDACG
jgi:hypothetical protein